MGKKSKKGILVYWKGGSLVANFVSNGLWNRCENDSLPSIKWVLGLAKAAVLRHGVHGIVIDPYNELDHQRPVSQ
ncbi:unnamed protein product [Ilex paraguariensis]|uniref:Uncharacterized protein n=1 Tax=Ilex paraguariensis TaxID=185542 RepID=A0ABC8S8X6_9AQUA